MNHFVITNHGNSSNYGSNPRIYRRSLLDFRIRWQNSITPSRSTIWQVLRGVSLHNTYTAPSFYLSGDPIDDELVRRLRRWTDRTEDWESYSRDFYFLRLQLLRDRLFRAENFLSFQIVSRFRGHNSYRFIRNNFPCDSCRLRNIRRQSEPRYLDPPYGTIPICIICELNLRLIELIIDEEFWRITVQVQLATHPDTETLDHPCNSVRHLVPSGIWAHIWDYVQVQSTVVPIPRPTAADGELEILFHVTEGHIRIAVHDTFSFPNNAIITTWAQAIRNNRLQPWRGPRYSRTIIDYPGPEHFVDNFETLLNPLESIVDPFPLGRPAIPFREFFVYPETSESDVEEEFEENESDDEDDN